MSTTTRAGEPESAAGPPTAPSARRRARRGGASAGSDRDARAAQRASRRSRRRGFWKLFGFVVGLALGAAIGLGLSAGVERLVATHDSSGGSPAFALTQLRADGRDVARLSELVAGAHRVRALRAAGEQAQATLALMRSRTVALASVGDRGVAVPVRRAHADAERAVAGWALLRTVSPANLDAWWTHSASRVLAALDHFRDHTGPVLAVLDPAAPTLIDAAPARLATLAAARRLRTAAQRLASWRTARIRYQHVAVLALADARSYQRAVNTQLARLGPRPARHARPVGQARRRSVAAGLDRLRSRAPTDVRPALDALVAALRGSADPATPLAGLTAAMNAYLHSIGTHAPKAPAI